MVACFKYISNTGNGKKKTEREGQKCTFGNFFLHFVPHSDVPYDWLNLTQNVNIHNLGWKHSY